MSSTAQQAQRNEENKETAPQVSRGDENEDAPDTPRDEFETESDAGDKDGAGGYSGGWKPVRTKTRRGRYICKGGAKVCGVSVSGDDSIQCEICEGWFHPRCQNISVEAFQAITKHELFWLCIECRDGLKDRLNVGKQLVDRIDKVEQKIVKVLKEPKFKDEMNEIQEKINKMEKEVMEKIKQQHSSVETTLKDQEKAINRLPEATADISTNKLRKLIKTREEEGREYNLLVHNVDESTSNDTETRIKQDKEAFQKMAKALVGETLDIHIEKVFRLGKKSADNSTKPRLMMIKLKSKEHVEELYKKRMKLKEVGFPNKYLTKDLSPEQREEQRKLREEWAVKGKGTHRIFRGKVVPRESETN